MREVFCTLSLSVAALDVDDLLVRAEGQYRHGSPGFFRPYDGGHPPEAATIEDLLVERVDNGEDITDLLDCAELDTVIDALIARAEGMTKDD